MDHISTRKDIGIVSIWVSKVPEIEVPKNYFADAFYLMYDFVYDPKVTNILV